MIACDLSGCPSLLLPFIFFLIVCIFLKLLMFNSFSIIILNLSDLIANKIFTKRFYREGVREYLFTSFAGWTKKTFTMVDAHPMLST